MALSVQKGDRHWRVVLSLAAEQYQPKDTTVVTYDRKVAALHTVCSKGLGHIKHFKQRIKGTYSFIITVH